MPWAATDAACSPAPNQGLIRWDYCQLFYQAKSRKPPCGENAPPGGANMHQNNARPCPLPYMLLPPHSPIPDQISRPKDKAEITGTGTVSPAVMHLPVTDSAPWACAHGPCRYSHKRRRSSCRARATAHRARHIKACKRPAAELQSSCSRAAASATIYLRTLTHLTTMP